MNIESNWFLLFVVAASAAAGAAVAWTSGRRRDRNAHHDEHKSAVTSWENEGGNLAPTPAPKSRN